MRGWALEIINYRAALTKARIMGLQVCGNSTYLVYKMCKQVCLAFNSAILEPEYGMEMARNLLVSWFMLNTYIV